MNLGLILSGVHIGQGAVVAAGVSWAGVSEAGGLDSVPDLEPQAVTEATMDRASRKATSFFMLFIFLHLLFLFVHTTLL